VPAVCTLVVGFTGYSLVYEQLSFWGATVGANITDTCRSSAAS
jgi:quinol-cytochrome oxidoreductase complex cytochrome b subunit